jgi:hypothetical protein
LDVTVLLSELSEVEKVRNYYSRSTDLIPDFRNRWEETQEKLRTLEDASKGIPSLI